MYPPLRRMEALNDPCSLLAGDAALPIPEK